MNKQSYYWSVNNKKIFTKNDAIRESSLTNGKISFHVGNDECWKLSQSINLNTSLDSLYLSRALQLRQNYKKLRLFFSGGSDSLNILKTFIKNNITLDEIVVRWSHKAIDGNFYVPNTNDVSAKNSLSEWDYAIKPTLEYVSLNYPKIKITIENNTRECLENASNFSVDNFLTLFERYTPIRGSLGSMIQRMGLEDECGAGQTFHHTANIFGIEKPLLFYKNHYCCFHGHQTGKTKLLQDFVGRFMGKNLIVVGDSLNNRFSKSNIVYNGVDLMKFYDLKKKREYIGGYFTQA